MERTNARNLTPTDLSEAVGLAVIDVSFISLSLILPPVAGLLEAPGGRIVALVKPQFEARPSEVEKGGVVRDSGVHESVLTVGVAVMVSCGGKTGVRTTATRRCDTH